MADDFYPFVDSGDPAPDNAHLTGDEEPETHSGETQDGRQITYATRISVYDDMLSTPRVIVVERSDVRTYLEEITNTVYRTMKEQGGTISLMVIRELVENFIHARFVEPVISILDGGNTVRFADQGPGIADKERAFEFGVTSANRDQKRYIRGTGAGLPMVQQYLENAGGAISIEDNLNSGTVVTVSVHPERVHEINHTVSRGAAVRGAKEGAFAQPAEAPRMTDNDPFAQTAPEHPAQPGYPYGYQPQMGSFWPNPTYQPQGHMPQQPSDPYQQVPYPQMECQMGGYPAQPAAGGYPLPGYGFSTIPQPYGQQRPYYQQQHPMNQQSPLPHVTERGMLALRFLEEHGSGGPTDLLGAFGESAPTWSRELSALTTQGLVRKQGQKRVLTEMGEIWLRQQP